MMVGNIGDGRININVLSVSGEGYDPKSGSDASFDKDVMDDNDPVKRLQFILNRDVSDEFKQRMIDNFRKHYPAVDKWLKDQGK